MKKINFSESFKKFESQKLDKAHNLFGGQKNQDCEDPTLDSYSHCESSANTGTSYDWSDGVSYSTSDPGVNFN